MNPLKRLWEEQGQAVWLDFIERSLLSTGRLARLVAEDGVRGVTSNPSIFQNAIEGSDAYDEAVNTLLQGDEKLSTTDLYEALAIADIQAAADVLRFLWEESGGSDGFVSLEVSPHLARDSEGTVEEARRLWTTVARPNLMIKVPATEEGIPAIHQLIADGINVNATLISRVDSKVDAALDAIGTPEALALRGKTAVANAKLAYRRFEELFRGETFSRLAEKGARVQRPLWASTSTKNPAYPDVIYVDELIGADTVNTLPVATLDAYRDHGDPRASLGVNVAEADGLFASVSEQGIDLDAITETLQVEGVAAFARSFDQLLAALEESTRSRS
jgi:transaldolase